MSADIVIIDAEQPELVIFMRGTNTTKKDSDNTRQHLLTL